MRTLEHTMWTVTAYGQQFWGTTSEIAMGRADRHGERHQLRAESLIAMPVRFTTEPRTVVTRIFEPGQFDCFA